MDRSLAVSTGSFYPEKTRETLARVAELGFKQVEITIQDSELNYDFHRQVKREYFEELRDRVRELELRVVSLHAPPLSGVDVFSYRARAEILMRTLEVASLLESDEIVVHPNHMFRSYEAACSFLSKPRLGLKDSVLPEFTSLLRGAEEDEIKIGIENIAHWHDHSFLNDPANMLRLVSSLNSESVAVDLDVFHSELGGNTLEFLDKLGEHVMSLHLCDCTDSRERTLPGKGRMNWEKLAERIGKLANLDYIVMEIAGQFEDEELRNSAGYLRGVFGLES